MPPATSRRRGSSRPVLLCMILRFAATAQSSRHWLTASSWAFAVAAQPNLPRAGVARSTMSCAASDNSMATTMDRLHPIGLGTFLMPRDKIQEALRAAIVDVGYRRIDCAPVYFNEDAVGDALHDILHSKDNPMERSDLYIVSKLASPFHTQVELGLRKTLLDLRLDYLDLYLVHWPVAFQPLPHAEELLKERGYPNEDIDDSGNGSKIDPSVSIHTVWQQMEALVDQGLVKEIGVANFPVALVHELCTQARIRPAVNQCEGHPYLNNVKLLDYGRRQGIPLQAYSPLGSPGFSEDDEPKVLADPVLQKIAAQHEVTPAQVALAWARQRGTSVVVQSTNPQHLRENWESQQVVLTEDDMAAINALDRRYRYFRPEEWWPEAAHAVFD